MVVVDQLRVGALEEQAEPAPELPRWTGVGVGEDLKGRSWLVSSFAWRPACEAPDSVSVPAGGLQGCSSMWFLQAGPSGARSVWPPDQKPGASALNNSCQSLSSMSGCDCWTMQFNIWTKSFGGILDTSNWYKTQNIYRCDCISHLDLDHLRILQDPAATRTWYWINRWTRTFYISSLVNSNREESQYNVPCVWWVVHCGKCRIPRHEDWMTKGPQLWV